MDIEQMKQEIKHIFDSGANEARVLELFKTQLERACKETAKNVRHEACNLNAKAYQASRPASEVVNIANQSIMNIQFEDVNPLNKQNK